MRNTETMTDAELVATILDRAPDESCDILAGLLVKEAGLTSPSASDDATRLDAAIELGRRVDAKHAARTITNVSDPVQAFRLIEPLVRGRQKEHFYAVCLDTKNNVIATKLISIGSLNASIVHPRELFKEAILSSACTVILAHNHPTGDSTPSISDRQLTDRLAEAGRILGIEVVDHVIVGGDGQEYTSFAEERLI